MKQIKSMVVLNQEQIKSFYDGFSDRLLKDFLRANKRVVSALTCILENIPLSTSRILDIGCGIGWSSYELARHFPDAEVIGIDLSPQLIGQASKLFNLPNLEYHTFDIISSSFDAESFTGVFDVIAMIDVFEHVQLDARQTFYAKTAKLLKNGSLIYLAFPSKEHLGWCMMKAPEKLQPVDNIVLLEDLQEWAKYIEGDILLYKYKSIWTENDYVHAILQAGKISYKERSGKFLTKTSLSTLFQRVNLITKVYPADKQRLYAFFLRRQLGNWRRAIFRYED
ncbi:MAG: methyltransferase domain-containing protein [Chitinophagales bacterium]|nr:methyltransferase domain-containing protein [Chitinophagales bacterium]